MFILDGFGATPPCAFCTVDCTFLFFWCVCVYTAQLDSRRIYGYSMCFCNYKGIFHSVMLINLISKSRNMKQELKKTDFYCGWIRASVLSANFFPSSAFFSSANSKRFNWG